MKLGGGTVHSGEQGGGTHSGSSQQSSGWAVAKGKHRFRFPLHSGLEGALSNRAGASQQRSQFVAAPYTSLNHCGLKYLKSSEN